MQLLRVLYLIIFSGSIGYFFLFGFIMRKLPKITISFEEDFSGSSINEYYQRTQERYQTDFKKGGRLEAVNSRSLVRDSNFVPTLVSSSKKFTSKTKSGDSDNDDTETGEAFVDFLSNFKSKDRLTESSLKVEETMAPPRTSKLVIKGVGLDGLMKNIDQLESMEASNESSPCVQPKRVGRLHVEKSRKKLSMEKVEKDLPFVSKGGIWKPTKCLATKVAIVVPFRDRQSHLSIFLNHIHRFLRWQLLDYRIFVIEQSSRSAFNRGMLMNIGFEEAMKRKKYDCVVFHDVDLIPEDDRNDYSCPSSPRHMSTAVDTMKYKLGYKKIFGGVEAFWPEHFRETNGFPNRYWGWGGEDDDLYVRTMKASLGLTRPAQRIGRYFMIKHRASAKNPNRHDMLRESRNHIKKDGLNSLKYEILSQNEHPLYTIITVDITPKDDAGNGWTLFG